MKIIRFTPEEREKSNICDQFENEIFTYSSIIPHFENMLRRVNATYRLADYVPKVYYAAYDYYPELSPSKESILVMENLAIQKFRMGPRLHLDEPHLFYMARTLGRYHSFTYGMRMSRDTKLLEFLNKIIPISFLDKNGDVSENNHIFVIAFERLFAYLDKTPKHMTDKKFVEDMQVLRTKYAEKPLELMEKLRIGSTEDYSVILHGDYLRNNVMFRYAKDNGYDDPLAMKILDFQEMRYGSPALDISLFMLFNMNADQYKTSWMPVFRCYHDTLLESLAEILRLDRNDKRLERYSFENFLDHFTKFALYGVMVSIMFVPWMTCSEDECEQLSKLAITDIKGDLLKEIIMTAGGDDTTEIQTAIAKKASIMGFFDNWY